MGVMIAEYFGQRTDVESPVIQPITMATPNKTCPFMNKKCAKVSKGLKPVCSVRKRNGDIWIVCRDRLCSTNKSISLTDYQKNILLSIAKKVFSPDIQKEHIFIKRETNIPVVGSSSYHADYIMIVQPPCAPIPVLSIFPLPHMVAGVLSILRQSISNKQNAF